VGFLAMLLENRGTQQMYVDNCLWSLDQLKAVVKRDGIAEPMSSTISIPKNQPNEVPNNVNSNNSNNNNISEKSNEGNDLHSDHIDCNSTTPDNSKPSESAISSAITPINTTSTTNSNNHNNNTPISPSVVTNLLDDLNDPDLMTYDHARCADCSYGYSMAVDCINHLAALQKQALDANKRLQSLVEMRERMLEASDLMRASFTDGNGGGSASPAGIFGSPNNNNNNQHHSTSNGHSNVDDDKR
jgi:hypothetical protein